MIDQTIQSLRTFYRKDWTFTTQRINEFTVFIVATSPNGRKSETFDKWGTLLGRTSK